MYLLRGILAFLLLAPFGVLPAGAQAVGALDVSGRLNIDKEKVLLKRKRFYLFRGGLDENKPLIDRLKTVEPTSRECFYCSISATPQYISWLKEGDCESPYCREITTEDIDNVPEFKTAYQKGLKQFRGKTGIAQTWLTTNLLPELRDGFYRRRKSFIDTLLAGTKPLQTAMTDTVSVRAVFIDIPLTGGDDGETFLISNLVPTEIGSKSYLWACEVDISSKKKSILALKVPDEGKQIKKCEVIVRDLPVCSAGSCKPK